MNTIILVILPQTTRSDLDRRYFNAASPGSPELPGAAQADVRVSSKARIEYFMATGLAASNRAEAGRGAPPAGSSWHEYSTGALRHCLQRFVRRLRVAKRSCHLSSFNSDGHFVTDNPSLPSSRRLIGLGGRGIISVGRRRLKDECDPVSARLEFVAPSDLLLRTERLRAGQRLASRERLPGTK